MLEGSDEVVEGRLCGNREASKALHLLREGTVESESLSQHQR